jgi:hypothetical protein
MNKLKCQLQSIRKAKIDFFMNFLHRHVETNQKQCIKLNMDIRISRFDFLRIKHLTWVGDFSSMCTSRPLSDHYNVLGTYFRVMNLMHIRNRNRSILHRDTAVFSSKNQQNRNISEKSKTESFDIFKFFS